jgi:beta-galactosidase
VTAGIAPSDPVRPSRRAVLRTGVTAALTAGLADGCAGSRAAASVPQTATFDFNQRWLFGSYTEGSAAAAFDDRRLAEVTLPHTVTPLSWGGWDPARWEGVWIYRKHFRSPWRNGYRVFADFDGVMVNATVLLNGVALGTHQGGYLPWSTELPRGRARDGSARDDNVLAVVVDARWLPVPPAGAPAGARAVDYLQPGGIYRDVTLRAVPEVFLSDVFARPDRVLDSGRGVQVQATIDAAAVPEGPALLTAQVRDGARTLASARTPVRITGPGITVASLTVTGVGEVALWSPDTPKLYTVRVTLAPPGRPPHTVEVRTGFREAVFRPGGFYLNGERLQIFGLNRHQLFPYTGMAAAARLQRRDAQILRRELNCNMVRCSHYPQSTHFLDACDELGLMVWQEPPGWHFVGDAAWQGIFLQNVSDMVIRDRSRPSVIAWGTRPDETANYPALFAQARQLAYDLDGSRPTTGAMDIYATAGWAEDVFGYDDYHSRDGQAELRPPLPGVPYLVSEAVGAIDGPPTYRWNDSAAVLAEQARLHAQVHDITRSDAGYAGLLGWAGFDYASLNGGDRIWDALKTPGVLDTFRAAKPGAAFYRSQQDPRLGPVIAPAFFWDPGPGGPPGGPPDGPGADAMIATNCDRLRIYVGGRHVVTATPDTRRFGHLAFPPVFVNLAERGPRPPAVARPDLRIDGYLGRRLVASVRLSSDPARDRLALTADDSSIEADGSDATRLTFRAVDAYGNQRRRAAGLVRLTLAGPGTLIGDNPFEFDRYGGVGGALVRSEPGLTGVVRVTASHPDLGRAEARVRVTRPAAGRQFR